MMSRVRRYASPCAVMRPRRVLPPVERWRGTSPSQAANCRPFLNSWPPVTLAWLNFYWNFYVAFTGVVIGCVFSSKGWPTSQRIVVSILYLGFVLSWWIASSSCFQRMTHRRPPSLIDSPKPTDISVSPSISPETCSSSFASGSSRGSLLEARLGRTAISAAPPARIRPSGLTLPRNAPGPHTSAPVTPKPHI